MFLYEVIRCHRNRRSIAYNHGAIGVLVFHSSGPNLETSCLSNAQVKRCGTLSFGHRRHEFNVSVSSALLASNHILDRELDSFDQDLYHSSSGRYLLASSDLIEDDSRG